MKKRLAYEMVNLTHDVRVLLAEDNLINQVLATTFLQKFGYAVDVAVNGKDVLAMVEKNKYDLILMDIQMPEMDGLEATRQIRLKPNPANNVKIMAMTASVIQSEIQQCFDAGMDGYIEKPFKPSELKSKITSLLTA